MRDAPNKSLCPTCEYKQQPDGGHCYMFKEEPQERCGQWRPGLERACCGTFHGSPHRSTCEKYRGKFKPEGRFWAMISRNGFFVEDEPRKTLHEGMTNPKLKAITFDAAWNEAKSLHEAQYGPIEVEG